MSDAAKIKEGLQMMVDGGFQGLEIDTPSEWVIEGLKQPIPFFEQLPALLPQDSILYIEGTEILPEVAAFYSAHRAPNSVKVRRDTIYPVPEMFHIVFSADVAAALLRFAEKYRVPEMFDHLKAYRDKTLLFSFHDAFDGVLRVSEHVSADKVANFCAALEVSSRHEKVRKIDPEEPRKILRALERLERSHAPWYKRAWYWITGA